MVDSGAGDSSRTHKNDHFALDRPTRAYLPRWSSRREKSLDLENHCRVDLTVRRPKRFLFDVLFIRRLQACLFDVLFIRRLQAAAPIGIQAPRTSRYVPSYTTRLTGGGGGWWVMLSNLVIVQSLRKWICEAFEVVVWI